MYMDEGNSVMCGALTGFFLALLTGFFLALMFTVIGAISYNEGFQSAKGIYQPPEKNHFTETPIEISGILKYKGE